MDSAPSAWLCWCSVRPSACASCVTSSCIWCTCRRSAVRSSAVRSSARRCAGAGTLPHMSNQWDVENRSRSTSHCAYCATLDDLLFGLCCTWLRFPVVFSFWTVAATLECQADLLASLVVQLWGTELSPPMASGLLPVVSFGL